jgi:hypothetical protein
MNRDRLEELLWERIDGNISPENLAELEAHLAEHPEPRELERDIRKLAELLDQPDEVAPPSELRARIDRSLETASAPWSGRHASPKPASTPGFHRGLPSWVPMAACLVIGVAIGFLLQSSPTAQIDPTQATGSMTAPTGYPDVQPAIVDLGESIGTLEIRRLQETIIIDLQFAETGGLELISELANGRRTTIDLDGPRTRRLVFDCPDALRLEVRQHGVIVAEQLIKASSSEVKP